MNSDLLNFLLMDIQVFRDRVAVRDRDPERTNDRAVVVAVVAYHLHNSARVLCKGGVQKTVGLVGWWQERLLLLLRLLLLTLRDLGDVHSRDGYGDGIDLLGLLMFLLRLRSHDVRGEM